MTTSEIEAWLNEHHPGKPWVVDEKLGVGLPMLDGVMLYLRTDGPTTLEKLAEQLVAMVTGKAMP